MYSPFCLIIIRSLHHIDKMYWNCCVFFLFFFRKVICCFETYQKALKLHRTVFEKRLLEGSLTMHLGNTISLETIDACDTHFVFHILRKPYAWHLRAQNLHGCSVSQVCVHLWKTKWFRFPCSEKLPLKILRFCRKPKIWK